MDALASLAFAIVIISNVEKLGVRSPGRKTAEILKSGLICAAGMSLIYASLAYMGATSLGSTGRADNGARIMSMVSEHYFGFTGKLLLASIVTVACLKQPWPDYFLRPDVRQDVSKLLHTTSMQYLLSYLLS